MPGVVRVWASERGVPVTVTLVALDAPLFDRFAEVMI